MFASTTYYWYQDSAKRGKMLILTTYYFFRLFGGGIDSTILGEMDRLCSLTIERGACQPCCGYIDKFSEGC